MAADTNISSGGGAPRVTVIGRNLVRYTCRFFLQKPAGETWPGGSRIKKIHQSVLNKDHSTDTFSLGNPANLNGLFLSWQIDMVLPGGVGGPLAYSVSVEIKQDGTQVMNPSWESPPGDIDTGVESIADGTDLKVS
jgi:hypothetical protein